MTLAQMETTQRVTLQPADVLQYISKLKSNKYIYYGFSS